MYHTHTQSKTHMHASVPKASKRVGEQGQCSSRGDRGTKMLSGGGWHVSMHCGCPTGKHLVNLGASLCVGIFGE